MPDKSSIVREAQKYLAKGQIDKAIVEWEKLVKESPDGTTFNTMGDLYLKKGDKRSAGEFFHKAADFFRAEGFSLKALALYKKIINIDPMDAGALVGLGELSEEKGLITDAIKNYLSAADILSKDITQDTNREKFINIYERIILLAPGNIPLREKIAGLFSKEGFIVNAIREYLFIARTCENKGDIEQAKIYLRKVIDLQPGNREAFVSLSHIFEKADDLLQAFECIREAMKTHHNDLDLVFRCATLLKRSEKYDEAMSYLSQALELNASHIDAQRLMGDLHLAKGDRERAWESYQSVIDHLLRENKIDAAIDLTRQFKDIHPVEIGKMLISLYRQKDDRDAVFEETLFVADLLLDTGQKDEAISYYHEALKIRPGDIQIKKILAEHEMGTTEEPSVEEKEKSIEDLLTDADIFMKYNLYDEARSILEELKVKDPSNMDVHKKLKSLYLETADKEQAVTECIILSELYGRSGDTAMKDAALKEAFTINPDDPRLSDRISHREGESVTPPVSESAVSESLDDYAEDVAEAEFYVRQGLKEDALRIFHKLLALFPGNSDLRSKVSALEGGIPESALSAKEAAADILEGEEGAEVLSSEKEAVEVDAIHDGGEQQLDTDVLDIFEEFKKGLEKELEDEDSETHYNLGIAYKEMGLIDDAIKEFQTSRSDPKCAVRSMTLLGICYMEKGLFPLAIESFKSAMDNITSRDESYWGAKYDLASAYEKNGSLREAFELYSEIYGQDSKFRQVAERLNHIKNMLSQEDATKQKGKKDRVSYI
jgi:tetratricopeptide (TPR) repeat protein